MALVAVTGPDGFVGRRVCEALVRRGHDVRPLVRDDDRAEVFASYGVPASAPVITGDIDGTTDWTAALAGVDAVIHLAARVHVMDDRSDDPLEAYRAVNTRGTARLAESAVAASVRRFVFVSTVKVNGESTTGRAPYRGDDEPAPMDPYGLSKLEAERELATIAADTGLEVTVIRPPLVHGPGVGGNLVNLLGLVARGVPLPLGSVRNSRSLVGVANLADALAVCVDHPAASGRTMTIADGEGVSTAELVRWIADGLGVAPRLIPVPSSLLRLGLSLIGKRGVHDRIAGDLEVDAATIRDTLEWSPPVDFREGVLEMARWYGESRS